MNLLAGVRVVEMTTLLPGPYAGFLLAEMGADVTKVEPPDGDPAEAMSPGAYRVLNGAKDVVRLDLKTDAGTEDLHELVRDADLFLSTNRMATLRKLGADPASLRQVNPDLVVVRLLGHDDEDRIGHDVTYLAAGGLLAAGDTDLPPAPIADLASAERVVSRSLGALVGRDRGGDPATLEVSAEGIAREWATAAGPVQSVLEATPGYGLYRCADGRVVALACLEDRYWERFLGAVDRPGWSKRRQAGDPDLDADVADLLKRRSCREWMAVFEEADVPAAPVGGLRDELT